MKLYRVVRELESGGSVGIGLNDKGNPAYVQTPDRIVEFSKEQDALKFMERCKNYLPTFKGQQEFKVSMLEVN